MAAFLRSKARLLHVDRAMVSVSLLGAWAVAPVWSSAGTDRLSAGGTLADDPPTSLPPLDTQAEIQRVAADLDVAPAVVEAHFEWKDEIGELRSQLRQTWSTFAGLWVDRSASDFAVTVAFTGPDPADQLAVAAASFPAPQLLRAVPAERTLAELEATLDDLIGPAGVRNAATLAPGASSFDAYIDEIANEVVVEAAGPDVASLVTEAMPAGGGVAVAVVDELSEPQSCTRTACTPNIVGGLATSTTCTTAFTADRAGVPGVLTAGHCDESISHDGSTLGPRVVEAWVNDGDPHNADAQWHQLPSTWVDIAAVYVGLPGEELRGISDVAAADEDYVGMPICSSGNVSGYDCGVITSLNYAPAYMPGGHDFRLADYAHAFGDSGAPVFFGDEAQGIHSGNRSSTGEAIYGHIELAEAALAVQVSTK